MICLKINKAQNMARLMKLGWVVEVGTGGWRIGHSSELVVGGRSRTPRYEDGDMLAQQ
jgi:hypothetical protein